MRDLDPLRRLARRLARDNPVDWEAGERSAQTEEERIAIRQLRIIAALAAFHRTSQAGDSSPDLSLSLSLARSAAALEGGLPPLASQTEPLLPAGSRWGHLEIHECVGRGAFGQVYRARDTRLDRDVALKILTPESADPSDETVGEARLLARIRHPNVVTVHGADRLDARLGIWMEFIRGQTLDEILRTRGVFDAREAVLVGVDLCRALSAVHAAGITHQDIKLGNVMRAEGGRIVLMDFGLGREAKREDWRDAMQGLSGTPLFMAPEVLEGERADARSDVYSLGVVLFALVTGALPVQAKSLSSLRAKHARGELRHARDLRPDLPEAFGHVLDRALTADPRQRFATPGEFERALLQTLGTVVQPLAGPARRKAPWMWPAGIVAVLGLVGATLLLGLRLGDGKTRVATVQPAPIPQTPALTLLGEKSSDMFGLAVAGVGDVDQDGFDDVLVGAPEADASGHKLGKVYLYRGSSTGLEPEPCWTAVGDRDSIKLGVSIAPFTRLAFDGFADIVVGALGSVRVYLGSKNGPGKEPDQILKGGTSQSLFGFAVATGDVNHDGLNDLLVGEPYYPSPPTNLGRAHLYLATFDNRFLAQPSWSHTGPTASQFGASVAFGDIDKDGYADAIVGAPIASLGPGLEQCGAAYVFRGTATGLDTVATILAGTQAGTQFGRGVAISDLNGDGFDDVLVGSEYGSNGEDSEGLVQVYWGSKAGVSTFPALLLEANTMGANFGGHVARLGDLDGDGCGEVFIGALRFQQTQPREGAAYIYSGSKTSQVAQTWFRAGGKASSWYGNACAPAGDVNGDGFPDILVAAAAWDTEFGSNVGRVDLFLNTRTH